MASRRVPCLNIFDEAQSLRAEGPEVLFFEQRIRVLGVSTSSFDRGLSGFATLGMWVLV